MLVSPMRPELYARNHDLWVRYPNAALAGICRTGRGHLSCKRYGTIVIMEACKLSSRRRVEWTGFAVLPTLGIVV